MWAFGEDCVDECPENTWTDEYECKQCNWGCSSCDDEDTCTGCLTGFVLTDTGRCVNTCPGEDYFFNPNSGICEQCDEGCGKCFYDTATRKQSCMACNEGFKLTPDLKCVEECHEAGFFDQDGTCKTKCDYGFGPNYGIGE